MTNQKKKAALVLSGGSILGLAHIGVLEVLEQEYEFDAVYGVSAGSLVGAGIASGMSSDEIRSAFFDTNFFKIGWDISRLNTGLITGSKIKKHFESILGEKNIEDLSIPLRVGTTEFDTGNYLQIKNGSISDALRASISLPMIFEPYLHPGTQKYLVDGGLTRNLPLQDAVDEYQGDTIIAINVLSVGELPQDFHQKKFWGWKKDMTTYLFHSYMILMNSQWHENMDSRVQMINPDLSEFRGYSVLKKYHQPIIEKGRQAGKKFLQEKTD